MAISSLAKRITSLTAARSISILSALLVSMVLTRLLSEDAYGAYRTVWILYGVMGPVVTSALTGLLYFRAGEQAHTANSLASVSVWSVFFGLIMAAFMALGFPIWKVIFHADGLQTAFFHFSVYLFFSGVTSSVEAIFIIKERKKWLFAHNLVSNSIEFSSVVIPFSLGYSLETVTLLLIIAPFLRTIFLILFIWKDMIAANWNTMKTVLLSDGKYMSGLLLITLSGIAAVQLDSWVIRWFYEDDAVFAIYTVGARKIPFLSALMSSVSAAMIVQIGKLLKEGKLQEAMPFLARTSGAIASIMLPFLAVVFVFAEELMLLLFGGYTESAPIFQIYLGTVLVHFFLTDTILLAKGKTNLVLKAGILELVVNIALSIPSVYVIGITGPAWVTLFTHMVFVLMCAKLVNKEFGTQQSILTYVSLKEARTGFWLALSVVLSLEWIKKVVGTSVFLFLISLIFIGILQFLLHRKQLNLLKDKVFNKGDVHDSELIQGY